MYYLSGGCLGKCLAAKIIELNGGFCSKPRLMTPESRMIILFFVNSNMRQTCCLVA